MSDDEDEGFSYPGCDSSEDDRSVTSSVDASVDASTELDRHPWRRTAAAAGGGVGTNTCAYYDPDGDGDDGGDASTLGDQNGPWVYAEPHGYEDGEYSLAGTAVSSLGVTSYNRTAATATRFIHFYCKIHLFKSKISRSVIPQNRTVRVNCYVARVLPSKACRVRHRAVAAQANKESK